MNNLIVFPLLIPLTTAVLMIFLHHHIAAQRWISAVSMVLNVAAAVMIVSQVRAEGIQTLYMGGWVPPYGILFAADMLAALLVLTTAVIGTACLLYAFRTIGEQRERHYFYPLFQFLVAGVMGSFLTGDLFNLFVCFEVMLISSYALIVLGGTKRQLRETLKYILINILSSTLFVAAVAYLYGVVGTLNMAQLSTRVAEAGQGGVLNVIAVLFLIVFSLKAGLFLFFWLPGSYSAPPAAVTALFGALLTKVGLYALIRTFTLIFYNDPGVTHAWIGGMAGATMILGGLGALAYSDIPRILNYNVVISVGFIAFGLSVATQDALEGAVLYLLHDMVAKALMFFLGGLIIAAAGTDRLKEMGGMIGRYPLLGWLFFVLALALAGVPPLSGFPGKLLMLRGGLDAEAYGLTAIALASSLVVLYSLMKIFMQAFWGEEKPEFAAQPVKPSRTIWLALGMTAALVVLLGIGSESVYALVSQAADGLVHPQSYIEAVLKE
ncbi:monovalent cation/H+ antiporter subunit D [Paenibacillus darwinianus]|uniref:Monovalent cation/H+ antiporter subunit D n=1 Tax=Paenibacillus darwinianus TaxID=1380763 RepID=A0A9W5W8D6_9BACL|nr:Na+/H+ antiporter subunit D [Paenibacillus darwinianus]EXX87066.1 monovalent cation/H+ antiporter subunit D [Paenibacillus darwinianus]EXX90590.1 monovalent cation/H+ antiporter subunit D [Paenibacillus darwinianus]EXX90616.1 monovalent cation/H+ antiporter subunit D [Paenibacillus darwinianus]